MSIRETLESLPSVASRRVNAREGYFTAGRMFALVADTTIWLRLPLPTGAQVVEAELGMALVESPIPNGLTWVAVPVPATDPVELHDLILQSHQAVRQASRRARRDRSTVRRRRVRTSA